MKRAVFILAAFFGLSLLFSQNEEVKIELHHGAYYDVFVTRKGRKINLTRFKKFELIEDLSLSPDGNYLFFRHRPDGSGAYRLSLYNMTTLKRIARITPGFGGLFTWNEIGQIIHIWGCGTSCSNMRVYNLQLHEIFYSLSTAGFELSPKKDIVIQSSMNQKQFWIFDLRTLKEGTLKGFAGTASEGSEDERVYYDLFSLEFTGDYVFQIPSYEDGDSQEKLTFDIVKLNLVPLKPEDTREFY